MTENVKEKTVEEKTLGELTAIRERIKYVFYTNVFLIALFSAVVMGTGGVTVRDGAVLAELKAMHKGMVIQYKEEHLYLTYDDLSTGHYKVVHVVNGADGTALLQIPGPHGYGERVVRKIPVELLVEGKEFNIDGSFSPKLRDLPQ